jgi:ankyrin repeat protein
MDDADKYGRELSELLFNDRKNAPPTLKQVQAFIAKGADINWRESDEDGTPLIEALNSGVDIMKEILSCDGVLVNTTCLINGQFDTPLIVASAFVDDVEYVKLLLAAEGIDINYQNCGGYTALMLCGFDSMKGGVEIAKLLLEDPRTNIHLTNSDANGRKTALAMLLDSDKKPDNSLGTANFELFEVERKAKIAWFKGEFLL